MAIFLIVMLILTLRSIYTAIGESKHKLVVSMISVVFLALIVVPTVFSFSKLLFNIQKDLQQETYGVWEGYVGTTRKASWMQVEVGGKYFYIGDDYNFLRGEQGEYYNVVVGYHSQAIVFAEKED